MKKKNTEYRKRLDDRDFRLLWALSGGFCAYCKKPFIDMETLECIVHQAHIISRHDTNVPSYREIPIKEKDKYENLFLLHPTCHEKTKYFSLEELQTIKTNHEKHVRDTLNGIYNPYPIGNGKFARYPHVVYYPKERAFNPFNAYAALFSIAIFNILLVFFFIYIMKEKWEINSVFLMSLLLIMSVMYIIKVIRDLKRRPATIIHEAKCIFSGCNGKVNIIHPSPIYDSMSKRNVPEPGIGMCSFDHTHTFTVPRDLSLSNRGDYHQFKIYP